MSRYARTVLVVVSAVTLILIWSISVALTGIISQLAYLTPLLSWLRWVDALSTWLFEFLQGILSQIILTALIMLLSNVLRIVIERQDLLTDVAVELSLQRSYFFFLFVQVFLIVSLSSSVIAIIEQLLHGLDSISTTLVIDLSKASNYFFSYLLLRYFSESASSLLQIGRLIEWVFLASVSNDTSRQK